MFYTTCKRTVWDEFYKFFIVSHTQQFIRKHFGGTWWRHTNHIQMKLHFPQSLSPSPTPFLWKHSLDLYLPQCLNTAKYLGCHTQSASNQMAGCVRVCMHMGVYVWVHECVCTCVCMRVWNVNISNVPMSPLSCFARLWALEHEFVSDASNWS